MGETCLFCGRPKDGWRSDVAVLVNGKPITIASVCPKCRTNHTILELYEKSALAGIEEMKAEVEKYFPTRKKRAGPC